MKIRTFFITYFAPCALLLLTAQLSFNILTSFKHREDSIGSLQLMIMLDQDLNEESVSSALSMVQNITREKVTMITPDEELERFKSKFGIDVMSVLSDNPFGVTLATSINFQDDPLIVKTQISRIKGVHSLAYPDAKRNEINVSFEDNHTKNKLLAVVLSISFLLVVWLSEHFEVTANLDIISERKASRVPISVIRNSFCVRAFVKGTLVGLMAAILFIALRMALSMNRQIDVMIDFDKCLMISAFTIVYSLIITLIMQYLAFDIDTNRIK